MADTKTTSDARQRLLDTADRLFYAEGIHSVGVDRVVAEAKVAKMTLYKHFPSKDDLVLAVLALREKAVLEAFETSIKRHRGRGKDPLDAFFAAFKGWLKGPEFRGCAFINAAVEFADPSHEAARFAAAHKRRFGEMLDRIVRDTAGQQALTALPAIGLLVEGAIVAAVMEQSAKPADVARDAARTLLEQAAKKN